MITVEEASKIILEKAKDFGTEKIPLDQATNRILREPIVADRHFPPYDRVTQSPEMVEHIRYEYAALMTMCDYYLGKVLDKMDEHNLWEDTMLIVNTDHGFLLDW